MPASSSMKIALTLAEAVRAACVEAALRGYQDAAMSGLCHEGAVEASIDAIRMVDVEALAQSIGREEP